VSIAVVVAASDAYAHHLPAWAESVKALTTQPDEIIVAAESLPFLDLPTWTYVPLDMSTVNFASIWNQAIAPARSDWVAWIGADDTYRPHALDDIEREDADVVAFGFQYDTGQQWLPQPTNASVRAVDSNHVTCGSPFRRSLWEKMPIPAQFGPLADWGFWTGLAFIGARFAATGRIDVDYAFAGHVNPPIEPTRTYMRDWVQSL
jgi:hypothetical protein